MLKNTKHDWFRNEKYEYVDAMDCLKLKKHGEIQ